MMICASSPLASSLRAEFLAPLTLLTQTCAVRKLDVAIEEQAAEKLYRGRLPEYICAFVTRVFKKQGFRELDQKHPHLLVAPSASWICEQACYDVARASRYHLEEEQECKAFGVVVRDRRDS